MSRVQWASLMVEASEMDVWQLAPVNLPQLHAEMTLATDIKLVRPPLRPPFPPLDKILNRSSCF